LSALKEVVIIAPSLLILIESEGATAKVNAPEESVIVLAPEGYAFTTAQALNFHIGLSPAHAKMIGHARFVIKLTISSTAKRSQ